MAEEQVRLLGCQQCRTIEEIPDYDGPPEYDHLLNNLVKRHETNGAKHIGALFKVPAKQWKDTNVQRDVSKQIAEKLSGGETGLGSAYYDLKNTFQADAMSCWTKEHNRNPACSDYRSDRKRLTPDTAADRKAAGLPEYRSNKDAYLCDFCPVQMLVEQAYHDKNLT